MATGEYDCVVRLYKGVVRNGRVEVDWEGDQPPADGTRAIVISGAGATITADEEDFMRRAIAAGGDVDAIMRRLDAGD